METRQTIVYYKDIDVLMLYRGGYDPVKEEGLDVYERDATPESTARGYSPTYPIKEGCFIFNGGVYDKQTQKLHLEFFFKDGVGGSKHKVVANGEFKVCFDAVGRTVIYRKGDPNPTRCEKMCKTRGGKFYKEWILPYTEHSTFAPPVKVRGWEFAKGQEYIIAGTLCDFDTLLPEYKLNRDWSEPLDEWREKLYNLEPIDLCGSWDYTEWEKVGIEEKVKAIKEEREKYLEELEKRKQTDGYCCMCGCAGASYVPNPYDEDINGVTRYQWLCRDCYSDIAGDI